MKIVPRHGEGLIGVALPMFLFSPHVAINKVNNMLGSSSGETPGKKKNCVAVVNFKQGHLEPIFALEPTAQILAGSLLEKGSKYVRPGLHIVYGCSFFSFHAFRFPD